MSVRANRNIAITNTLEKNGPSSNTMVMASVDAYQSLSPAEQAVVELGIKPGQLQPIKHLNESHYKHLCRKGMLDGDLQRRIEAHKYVSQHTTP